MFNFVFDRCIDGKPYPNLAPIEYSQKSGYHGMGNTYPYIGPLRLHNFCGDHQFPVTISYTNQPIPEHALYPIGISWFDHTVDYFGMMPLETLELCQTGLLTMLFYYHEGDDPHIQKIRLDQLCCNYNLPTTSYKFISGNTTADSIEGFLFFADHELFYWRNSVLHNTRFMPGCSFHDRIRNYQFTALSRVHKWWRATIMSYLRDNNFLNKSRWSYNTVDIGELPGDNPIMLDNFPGLREKIKTFVKYAPYACDAMTAEEQNSHWNIVPEHFDDAYCNLVLETLYSAGKGGGSFISEKTFKPIRNAQPFVIFGTEKSLSTLKKLGYRTFDKMIDNVYDEILDPTERFIATVATIEKLLNTDLHAFYLLCKTDILHNQELFLSSKYNRIEELFNKIITNVR